MKTRVPFSVFGASLFTKARLQSPVPPLRLAPKFEKKMPGAAGVLSAKVAPAQTPAEVNDGAAAPMLVEKGSRASWVTSASDSAFV